MRFGPHSFRIQSYLILFNRIYRVPRLQRLQTVRGFENSGRVFGARLLGCSRARPGFLADLAARLRAFAGRKPCRTLHLGSGTQPTPRSADTALVSGLCAVALRSLTAGCAAGCGGQLVPRNQSTGVGQPQTCASASSTAAFSIFYYPFRTKFWRFFFSWPEPAASGTAP